MSADIFFDNKKYISVKAAASLTGYSRDYVGQLCRQNKVDSKKVGNTWYVSEESILIYKNTPIDFDFAKNLGYEKKVINTEPVKITEPVADLVSENTLENTVEEKVATLPEVVVPTPVFEKAPNKVSPKKTLSKKVLDSTHNSLFVKPQYGLYAMHAVAIIALIVSGLFSVPQMFASAYRLAGASVSQAQNIVTVDVPVVAKKISRVLDTAPQDLYATLDTVSRFYAYELGSVYVRAGNYLQDTSFGFLHEAGLFAQNPPVYILNQFAKVAEGSVRVVDTSIDTSIATVSDVHYKTFAFISSTTNEMIVSTNESLLATPVLAINAVTPVDTAGVVVYKKVNSFFETAVYNPVANLFVKPAPVFVQNPIPANPKQTSANLVTKVEVKENVPTRVITNKVVVERVVEKTVNVGITQAELNDRLQQLDNAISSKFYQQSTGTGGNVTNIYQQIASSQKIDKLANVTIDNATINGGTINNVTFGTSTIANLSVSNTSTSTFAGGVDISTGCFSINGVCLGSSGGTLSSLNGQSGTSQTFATSSVDGGFGFSSSGNVHTLNIPTASASSLGLLSSADWTIFNNKVSATRSINTTYPLQGGGDLSANRTITLAFGTTTANAWSGLQQFNGNASTTQLSSLDTISVGRNATTTINGETSATSTFAGGVSITRGLQLNNGYVFGAGLTSCSSSSDKLIWNSSTGQFGCGADAGAGGGITAIGAQYSSFQTGSSQTFATTSDTNINLAITSSGNTHTFTPSWVGVLSVARGGTGISSPSAAGVLLGNYAGTGYQQIATSSLGLLTTNVAEGSNLYYLDSRVQSFVNASTTVPKTYSTNTFTGNNTFNGSLTLGSLNGPLQANAGVVSATSSIGVVYGGTGWSNIQANTLLLGNGTGQLATTTAGTNGQVLALVNGIPSWTATTTFSTGLTYASGNVTVNTTQNIAKLSNLTTNGFVKTSGSDGTLSVDTSTYLTTALTSIGPLNQTTTGPAVTFATSTTGSDFTITGSGSTLTFNIPTASASNRGLLSTTDWTTFNNKLSGLGSGYATTTQTGSLTLSTTTLSFNGLTLGQNIVPTAGALTFTPTLSGTLTVVGGGTGWSNIQANTLLLGNGTGQLATTTAGTNGQVLALFNGVPTWQSTTTLSTISGLLSVAKGGTNATSFSPNSIIISDSLGTTLVATGTQLTVGNILATTTATSTLPTLLTTNATTTSFAITGITSSLLKTNSTGGLVPAIAGTDYIAGGTLSLANGGTATTTFYNGGVVFSDGTKLTQSAVASDFFWDNTNKRLGIGTSTPFAQLSVNSTAGVAPFVVGSSTATSLIVDRNGVVGIGTTTPSSLAQEFAIQGVSTVAASPLVQITATSNGTGNIMNIMTQGTAVPILEVRQNGDFFLGANAAGGSTSSNFALSNGQIFILNGKNTSTASDKLTINPTSIANASGVNNMMNISLPDGTTGTGSIVGLNMNKTGSGTGTGTKLFVNFQNNANSKFAITTEGVLGMGTTTPFGLMQLSTSTASNTFKPQLVLSDQNAGTNLKHWTVSAQGGNFYIATSSDVYATSTVPAVTVLSNANVGIATSSPYAPLSVVGQIVGSYYTASSVSTSTFTGGIQTNLLSVTSTTASSTFANGINLTAGCFSIAGTCVGGSSFSNTLANGGTATTTFYNGGIVFSDGTKLTQAPLQSDLFWDNTNKRLGIGTSSPYAPLSVVGQIVGSFYTATTTATSTLPTLLTTNATTTSFAITGITSSLLKTNSTGGLVPAIAGTDYLTTALSALGSGYATTTQTAIAFSTSTLSFNGLTLGQTIVPTAGALTFTPTLSGILTAAGGGTGISSPSAAGVLLGNYAGTGYQQIATSSLGLLTTNVAEGSNLYYLDSRVQSFVHASTTIPKTYSTNTFTGNNTFNGSLTLGSLNGPLQANAGVVSATSSIGVVYGGTGWSNIQANTLLLGNGTGQLATTSAGTDGQVLALVNGVPTWQATTTLSTISGLLSVARGGTNATSFSPNSIIISDSLGTTLIATGTQLTVGNILATTTATSTLPTLLTTNATTTSFAITGITSSLLKTNSTGGLVPAIAGTDYLTTALSALGSGYATTTQTAIAFSTSTLSFNGLTLGQTIVPTAGALTFTPTLSGTLSLTGGGTATTTFYNGGVVFSDGSKLTQSAVASDFFWDNTNKELGIGTSTPFAQLSVNSRAGVAPFVVGSTTATSLIVDRNGVVGIGTTSPSTLATRLAIQGVSSAAANALVQITSTSNGTGNILNLMTQGTAVPILEVRQNGDFFLGANAAGGSTSSNFALSNGQIFILNGKNTSTASDKLTINPTSIANASGVNNMMNISLPDGTTGTGSIVGLNMNKTGSGTGTGTKLFVNFQNNANSKFAITTEGVLGMGTTTPFGLMQLSTSTASNTFKPQLVLSDQNAGTNLKHWTVSAQGGNFYIATSSDVYATSTVPAVTVLSNANTGISTSTPWKTFSVVGNVALSGLSTAVSGDSAICLSTSNEVRVNSGATSCVVSSARYKYDIQTSNRGLDLVRAMRPVSFKYNGTTDERLGFIAEEVDLLEPRLVARNSEGQVQTVRYEEFTSVLAKSIQELDTKVTSMDMRLTALESLVGTTTNTTNNFAGTLASLDTLGARFTQGMAYVKNLVVDTLTVGSTQKPSGITLYDEVTKSPYCFKMQNGAAVYLAGVCTTASEPTASTTPVIVSTKTDTTAPVITILGDNPAKIPVGSSYVDFGATVTDTDGSGAVNNNLGISFEVDGVKMSEITLDTATTSVHTIIYSSIDGAGNMANATRTVEVIAQ